MKNEAKKRALVSCGTTSNAQKHMYICRNYTKSMSNIMKIQTHRTKMFDETQTPEMGGKVHQ